MPKLLTVDVWDTLLRRRVHPDQVKHAAALHLSLALARHADGPAPSAQEVLRRRLKVESQLARADKAAGNDGEYEITQVITQVVAGFVADKAVSRRIVEAAVTYELDYEIKNSYPDPQIMDLIESYQADQVWFVSDFYMGASRLKTILAAHGVELDDGVVSCDVGKNKRQGGLYEYLRQKAGDNGASHVHIGDNEHADVAKARAHGIEARHYCPQREEQLRQERGARFIDRDYSLAKMFTDAAERCRRARAEALSGQDLGQGYDLGLSAAPLFIGFALSIAEYAARQHLPHIYFFTREGVFFKKLFDAVFADGKLAGLKLPPGDLLHVSRVATFGASLDAVDARSLMRLWRLYFYQSLNALFESLNMPALTAVARAEGFDCDKIRRCPWRDSEVIAALANPAIQARIAAERATLRRRLRGYLEQSGFGRQTRVAVVDIGWRGTIQDNLAYLYPRVESHGLYLGLAKYLNEQPANTRKSAYAVDINSGRGRRGMLDQVDILEMLCNCPSGSVTGYADEGGVWKPITREIEKENEAHGMVVRRFQQAALDMAVSARADLERHAVESHELRPMAEKIFKGLMSLKDPALMDVYLSAEHNEIFGVGVVRARNLLPSWRAILAAPFNASERMNLVSYLRMNQKVNVVWSRREEGLPKRVATVALICMAFLYKRCFLRLRAELKGIDV